MASKPVARLTQDMRETIVDRVKANSFKQEFADHHKAVQKFCAKVYRSVVSASQENDLRRLAEELQGFIGFGTRFDVFTKGRRGAVMFTSDRSYPMPLYYSRLEVENTELALEGEVLEKQYRALYDRLCTVTQTVAGAMRAYKTVPQLLEAMPDLEPYLNAEWKNPPARLLPVVDTAGILKTLKSAGALPAPKGAAAA